MEKKIFLKISEIKDIFIKKIKTFEDYNTNKNIIISSIEEIEKMLKELFDINIQNNIPTNFEPKENNINNINNQQKEEDETKQIKQKSNDNTYNNIEKENDITKENNNEHEINDNEIKIEVKEGDIDNLNVKNETEKLTNKEEIINNVDNTDDENVNKNENIKKDVMNQRSEILSKKNDVNKNLDIQEEENDNKYLLPKLNFDYDKNINEILNDINMEQERPFLKTSLDNDKSSDFNYNIKDEISKNKNKNNSINTDIIRNISKKKEEQKKNQQYPIHYLIKSKNEQNIPYNIGEINNEEDLEKMNNIKISNLQKNGYSDLFSFNQDVSNINNKSSYTTDEFSNKKKNKDIINKKEDEPLNINNNNFMDINTNNTIQNDINNKQNIGPVSSNNESENENNIKNSKALRVADIIMKINSNDILYDIITQLYTKDILNQLMSPNVDINLINLIEGTIEKITILENEEIQKLRNKESSQEDNNNISINNNINNNNIYNKNSDIDDNNSNINNLNINNIKLSIPKKNDDFLKNRTSFSFYDKSNSSCYSQLPPKVPVKRQMNKYKAEYLNSEILQNYPKTGKTILGYEKFKKDRSRDFNFERSLRNDKYMNDYRKMKNYNFNTSKADSIGKNQSYHSNNRSFSNKKAIFNNYTSPFGDYFDSSLQKGGQSKLKMDIYKSTNNNLYKNCRSPVKDYIDVINDVYL